MARYSREVTPESLLDAYRAGIFPMAESADDPELYWVSPTRRGILPLDGFHLPRRLARTIRSDRFEVVVDRDFDGVIDGCAAPGPGRTNTWINAEIRSLYHALYCRGDVHTVAVRRDGRLVGGLYGVRIGGAFFGESMFSRETDASKVALAHLVARMRVGGFRLLDTQFITEHLAQFGTVEVPRATYHALLAEALRVRADFHLLSPPGVPVPGEVVTELLTSPETVETLRRR